MRSMARARPMIKQMMIRDMNSGPPSMNLVLRAWLMGPSLPLRRSAALISSWANALTAERAMVAAPAKNMKNFFIMNLIMY